MNLGTHGLIDKLFSKTQFDCVINIIFNSNIIIIIDIIITMYIYTNIFCLCDDAPFDFNFFSDDKNYILTI